MQHRNLGHFFAAAAFCLLPFAGLSTPAMAAPATPDGARSLQAVFETYLGKPAAGTKGAVRVVPMGERYKIALDFQTLAAPLQSLGITVAMAPYEMFVAEGDKGLWKVSFDKFPTINIIAKGQTIVVATTGYKFTGTFDAKLKAFILGTAKIEKIESISLAPGMEQQSTNTGVSMTISGVGSGKGTVTGIVQQSAISARQTFRLTKGRSAKPAMEISLGYGPMSSNLVIDQIKNDSLMSLWAFGVANPSAKRLVGNFETLRGILKSVMPIFNSVSQDIKAQNFVLGTPLGAFKATSLSGTFAMAGIVPKGRVALKLDVDGLSVPAKVANGMLPPWSKGLLPKKIAFDVTVSGYNLAAAANEILNNFKIKGSKSESKALFARAGLLVVPNKQLNVKIGPTKIVSDLLSIEISGDMVVMKPVPKGTLTVRAKGLDETIKALQPFVTKDKNLQKALLGMIAAKGFGKALPDGRMEWIISVDPEAGSATVNGFKLPLPGRFRKRK